jgi:hypothetical protein
VCIVLDLNNKVKKNPAEAGLKDQLTQELVLER